MRVVKYIMIPFMFVSCNGGKDYQKSLDNEVKYGLIMHFIMNVAKPITVVDMMDGTVKAEEEGSTNYYYKKCLQGQVYRQVENDCQGTGSESDNYGAVQLQYCDAADNSCNGNENYNSLNGNGNLDGNGNSEAYKSCYTDTTLGRDWKVPTYYRDIFRTPYRETIYSHIVSKDLKLWTSSSSSYNSELAEYVAARLNSYNDESKTNRNYVLCFSYE